MPPREMKLAVKALRLHILAEQKNVDRMIGPITIFEAKDLFTPLGYREAEINAIVVNYQDKYK